MIFFNQNNYPTVPYPSKDNPSATVKSGGCGVCSAANILAFYGINGYTPVELARIFMSRGARVSGGTDMMLASKILCELGNLEFSATNTSAELVRHLQSGGAAIANVDGDIGPKGIFSNAGHYINVIGFAESRLNIFDVGYYAGKFSSAYRKSLVEIKQDKFGNTIQLCTPATLEIDTQARSPNYYLFWKKGVKAVTKDEAKLIVKEKCKLSDQTLQYIADDYRWGDELIVKLAEAMR